jgi:hypothetical protein
MNVHFIIMVRKERYDIEERKKLNQAIRQQNIMLHFDKYFSGLVFRL